MTPFAPEKCSFASSAVNQPEIESMVSDIHYTGFSIRIQMVPERKAYFAELSLLAQARYLQVHIH